jgi:hypothetical protein
VNKYKQIERGNNTNLKHVRLIELNGIGLAIVQEYQSFDLTCLDLDHIDHVFDQIV